MQNLIDQVRDAVIGERMPIQTAFGIKPLVYADYTASGRALTFVEDYLRNEVLPLYANTHTEASHTGAATSQLRESARGQIARSVNARSNDKVIFCGSGATSAINKLIALLGLNRPVGQRGRALTDGLPDETPVVFIGPYEHHSNELPWRESCCEVVVIPLTPEGSIDLDVLEQKLKTYEHRQLKIGSFSAASNVTGIKTDVEPLSALLSRYGALSCWDYAAAAPYCEIDMQAGPGKDAIFISPHKFPGGVGTPGVLVVRGELMTNPVPTLPGGGTVSFVTPDRHRYVVDKVRREEGGTPAILESIRAGLVFKLKDAVGVQAIEEREQQFVNRAFAAWSANSNLEILGGTKLPRLAIFSLRFRYQDDYLPYGFVVALLNDLFGIQARGGCSCAGPYAHHLLGITPDESACIEQKVIEGDTSARPGWVRLSFNYFFDEATFSYLLGAIELIALHGWKLLADYQLDPAKGVWLYRGQNERKPFSIESFNFAAITNPPPKAIPVEELAFLLGHAEQQISGTAMRSAEMRSAETRSAETRSARVS